MIKLNPVRYRYWLSVITGGVLLIVLIYFALTAITAYSTRFILRDRLATVVNPSNNFAINYLDGGMNWSRLQLHLGITDFVLNANLQHYGLSTKIIGNIVNTNATPIAVFTGQINYSLGFNGISAAVTLDMTVANGSWHFPTGTLTSGASSLHLEIHNSDQDWNFDEQIKAIDLYYQGIPVLRISSLVQLSQSVLTQNAAGDLGWNSHINLDAISDYGPLKIEMDVMAPPDITAIVHTGQLRTRAILPLELWNLMGELQPNLVQYLSSKGMASMRDDVLLIDALLRDGIWYAPNKPKINKLDTNNKHP